MNEYLPYDPGILPSSPAPLAGEGIALKIPGLPPYKDEHFSIRNPSHKIYPRFTSLRRAAMDQMAGRAPYRGPVRIEFVMHAPEFEKNRNLTDYYDGISDTLDGSHGETFTYLPIVYEDDCQIVDFKSQFLKDDRVWYELKIEFLDNTEPANESVHRVADKSGSR
jgi:hypothetical protein